jgi:phosphatidylglycerol:prolipoprotein diacylglycerol transferase
MLAALPFPDIGPAIFTIPLFGFELSLRWYALAYIVGLILGWRIVTGLMRRPALWPANAAPMTPLQVEEVLTAVILGVVIGGRLAFVLVYEPAYYLTQPLEIMKVWEGGMSFHGGFLGVVVAGWWYCRRHGIPMLSAADAFALAAPPGLFLGRIANFINAELWGRPTALPWGVIFPGAAAQDCPGTDPGMCARHPSQLYEAGLEGLVLGLILWALVRAGALKVPGRVLGVFLLGYGLSRMFVELFRQADAQFITPDNPMGHVVGGAVVGLSMGQLLSLPMVLAGLWFLIRARKT